eukprot:XP_001689927.1 predicted protein [Chlamydomonas reinhardtii]
MQKWGPSSCTAMPVTSTSSRGTLTRTPPSASRRQSSRSDYARPGGHSFFAHHLPVPPPISEQPEVAVGLPDFPTMSNRRLSRR